MSQFFKYQQGELFAEGVAVSTLADKFGTPLYVYSRGALTAHYQAYADALGSFPGMVCYAVKANSNIGVLNVLAKLGAGFDIVSRGELERALKAGANPAKVVFSGVGKQADEMRFALEVGVHCFNVESPAELERLNEVAGEMGKKAAISIRVNPDVDAQTHPYISTGLKENKFGIDIQLAPEVYARAKQLPNIEIKGVDCHIGSQLTQLRPFLDALDRVLALVDKLADMGINIEHLDLGGGLGVTYRDETPPTPAQYLSAVKEKLAGRKLSIILEPGRSIAANAGIFVTKVEYLKCTEHKNFAIIDGAMNDLIRPALYGAWQDIVAVKETSSAQKMKYDLVGPVCETGDFLGKERELAIEQGDLLVVKSAGAYGFVMASNYNTRNRPAEIMVDGNECYVVRARETFEYQFSLESILPA